MPSLTEFLGHIFSTSVDVAALAVLLVFLPLLIVLTVRAQGGKRFPLRPIPVYEKLRQLVSYATESGRPIHVALGVGPLGGEATPDVVMGLTVFDYVARHAAACDQPVCGSAGDPTLLAAAQGLLHTAKEEAGFLERTPGQAVHFYGPDPLAYAAGASHLLGVENQPANVLLGRFGAEGLWLAEAMASQGSAQLGGTTDPAAMPLLTAALDEVVIGEEVYAAGAYLHRPSHLGSLAAQDIMRIIILLTIVIGVILTTWGYW